MNRRSVRPLGKANTDCLFYKLPGHLNTLTICRLSYAVIVEIVVERMEKQQGRRAKGAMLTTAEEEEAGSFILLPSFPASLTSCLLAASFCSFSETCIFSRQKFSHYI